MSFSKAKVQRFNDVKEYTPSPAKYNISTQEKIKLGLISKSKQYVKKSGSPLSSDAGSVHSTPCFQTPTLPLKRKKLLGMSFKSTKGDTKLNAQEELRDKIVECNNKDLYIKDLLEQKEEMTGKLNSLKKDYEKVQDEKKDCEAVLVNLKQQCKEESLQRTRDYKKIGDNLKEVNGGIKRVRQECEELKCQNFVDLSKILGYIGHFETLMKKTVEESRQELEEKLAEYQQREQHIKQESSREKEVILKKLEESEAKVQLLEENFKDVNILTELQMAEKIEEIENAWKVKIEAKEQESEAILKECQAISEYNIIQCEIEKNQIKNTLEEVSAKNQKLQEEMNHLKIEKHAYELSITTFKDTIEVLKKRLLSSDRDVEQLKEELEKSEEKILCFERKVMELTGQLNEVQLANEELEMQYESTSKLMQNQVKTIEKDLLRKLHYLKEESMKSQENKDLLEEVLKQFHQQQQIINEAQTVISDSSCTIESLEEKQIELETELKSCKDKLAEENEECSETRKKYDKLAHEFESILQELDITKAKVEELQKLIGPYQEQLEASQTELNILKNEKIALQKEVDDTNAKYAQILGHQNINQKVKHVNALKMKSSELFQKNLDLEEKNCKQHKTIEKLMKEIEDLRKCGKKNKDKENFGSPKVAKGSPCPLRDKN